jgi:hypothetical protein
VCDLENEEAKTRKWVVKARRRRKRRRRTTTTTNYSIVIPTRFGEIFSTFRGL